MKQFTKSVLETALNEEMIEHLGHEKTAPTWVVVRGMCATGRVPKTLLTEGTGHVTIDAPRDRDGTFEPQIAGALAVLLCRLALVA